MSEHKGLLNPNFWRILVVNFLVSTSVYMLMPMWPRLLEANYGEDVNRSGWTMLMFGLGLLLPGAVCSYLLDRFKRKTVCIWSIIALAAVCYACEQPYSLIVMALLRLVQGAAFIVFHIALGSTILIDITDTNRRDVTTYLYYWACRFSLALGPVVCILMWQMGWQHYFHLLPIGFAIVSFALVLAMKVPFRTPLGRKMFSKDRFLLSHSIRLILTMLPVSMAAGLLMALNTHLLFYAHMFLGLAMALVLHFIIYVRADVRAEIVTGLMALVASYLLLIFNDDEQMVLFSSSLLGYGLGAVSGRLQSFFTIISQHTERGSAQTTYKICFDLGISVGFFVGAMLLAQLPLQICYITGLVMVLLAIVFYLSCSHRWFVNHVQR